MTEQSEVDVMFPSKMTEEVGSWTPNSLAIPNSDVLRPFRPSPLFQNERVNSSDIGKRRAYITEGNPVTVHFERCESSK